MLVQSDWYVKYKEMRGLYTPFEQDDFYCPLGAASRYIGEHTNVPFQEESIRIFMRLNPNLSSNDGKRYYRKMLVAVDNTEEDRAEPGWEVLKEAMSQC